MNVFGLIDIFFSFLYTDSQISIKKERSGFAPLFETVQNAIKFWIVAVLLPNSMFYFVLVLAGNELDARNSNGRKKESSTSYLFWRDGEVGKKEKRKQY